MKCTALLLVLSFGALLCSAVQVQLNNTTPRRDTSGNIMDIHDGNTFYNEKYGLYFYYGASYGSCQEPKGSNGCADIATGNCGFRLDHNVTLFTSPDLMTWTPHPLVYQMSSFPVPGILFCPKVLFNAKNNNYVLWFNWIDAKAGFSASYYASAISPTPFGPFKLVNQNIQMGVENTGDFGLFTDDDGTAYVIYTAHITGYSVTHQMSVEQLSDDYLTSMGINYNSGFFGDANVEAPAMFKRNGLYYAVFGACCCYCGGGSPVVVHTAPKPMGPWTTQNSLGPNIPAQQTYIVTYKSDDGDQFLWQGDRWQSSPDGEKGHDFSYWGPLSFDSQNNIQPLTFLDSFTIDVEN